MLASIEILTKKERLKISQDSQRKKFKLTGQTILKGDHISNYDFSKRLSNESDNGNQQALLMKIGYSVADDHNQDYERRNRGYSISTDIQSGNRLATLKSDSNTIVKRGQSTEMNNNSQFMNCQRTNIYNARTIRKTFQYDDSDSGLENLNDNTNKKIDNNTQIINKQISFEKEKISNIPTMIKFKFQRIRRCFQIIKALFRMKTLCKQKKSSWALKQDILRRNQRSLKFNESLTMIKIKQWTYMVFSKMISIIQQKKLDKCKLNFIDNPESMSLLEKDQAIIFILNILTFSMSNLVIMSSSTNLLKELQIIMYQEQFFEYRKIFSKFVSQRANYINQQYQELNQQEKQIILSECIIINYLITSLVKLTESIDILKCNKSSIEFLIRCLISLIQYFFIQHFINFPKIEMKNQKITFSQYQLGKNSTSIIILQTNQIKSDDLIFGTYTEQQLKDFISKDNWLEANKKKMSQIVTNLNSVF
ncbi:unnamed protein product [Paramecium primaurelia]|uniref:Uncharacterized protein n=1 Tax=Paramecium primaurelia TaxID=5886 RepID=A0A8S1LUT7_PARPR|nr:unnamed protein product [Paramecium primaurelia]